MPTKTQLDILRCPRHGLVAVTIGERRISPAKCCGQWEHLIGWSVDAADVRAALPRARRRKGPARRSA